MIVLSITDVTKRFGPEPILEGVSLEIRPGEKIGLVGPNGAGKTTLLKILAGRMDPDSGKVELHSSARLEYLEQEPTVVPGRTLWDEAQSGLAELIALSREAEEVAHALSAAADPDEHHRLAQRFDRLHHEIEKRNAYNVDHQIERVLDGLGFTRESFQQPVESLSGGQHNRLLLAKMLLRNPDVMLLDEPSNHLDIEATEWLESFLMESRQAMVVVSHDRYFLDKVTERTWELYRATVDDYVGNFSAYWGQKAERLKVQSRTFDKQQAMIAKTEDFIRKNHYGQKATQAKDREKKLARVDRVSAPREIVAPTMGFPPADRTGDMVLRVEHLSKAYAKPLFSDLSFDVERGQRWGILGPNGTGKTTLLRCLIGQATADAGEAILGTGVRVGYYDQLLSGLDPDAQVVEAVRPPHKEFNEPQRRNLLARFGLQGEAVFQKVGSLSGGERGRAALALLSASDANFLILDEPTNHLDLWACDSLERSLNEFEGTVLFVSHDRYFLNRVADHLLIVEPGRFRIIEGNYDTYLHLVRQGLAGAGTGPNNAKGKKDTKADDKIETQRAKSSTKAAKPKRRFPYRKLEDLETEIFERESRIEELHTSLSSPEVLRDGAKVKAAQAELVENQQTLATLYEHWEEASELN